MQYNVVKYSSKHRQDVLELQKHLWNPQVEINDAYLSWKYECNPYLNDCLIYLVLKDGRVVGMRGAYGTKWHAGQNREALPVACVGDLVIDPEHRDKGLFKQIMDFMLDDLANQGYTFVFNLSAGTLTQLGALAMGWRSIGVLDVRQRIGYVYRVLRRVRYHLRIEETKPFDRIDRKLGKTFTRNGRSISLEQKPRPEQMASLVANLKRKNRLAHEKSIKFFRWRFDNPIANYRFLFSGDLEGYLVLQTNRTYDPCLVQIVDWEADEFPILEELLNTAVDLCKFMRLSITLPRFDPQMSDLLEQLRFTKDPFGTRIEDYRPMILLRSVSNEMLRDEWTVNGLDLVDADNWDMRPIYSDGF